MKLKFEPTISLGHLAELLVLVGAIITAYINIQVTLQSHDKIIHEMRKTQLDLVSSQNNLGKNLSVLSAILQERTAKKVDLTQGGQ